MKISQAENQLVGKWIYSNGTIHKDFTSERIEWLITNYLKKIKTDETGWDILYIDPADNRLWELIYPQSELHGGGPPSLVNLSAEDAKKKYGIY